MGLSLLVVGLAALLSLPFFASQKLPFLVTKPGDGSQVALEFSVQGQASPYQTVEVVAEYPPSQLAGYETYHDVVGRWHGTIDPGGHFSVPIRLEHLPSAARLVLFVKPGSERPRRIEIRVER